LIEVIIDYWALSHNCCSGARLLRYARRAKAVGGKLNGHQYRAFTRRSLPRPQQILLDRFATRSCLSYWFNGHLAS
jgi:hypothetical protein